jgi:phage gp16-like protein
MASNAIPAARPAQFDRAAQHRRAMIAKINIARQQLGMVEDDYRQMLLDTTGRLSLRECSDAQLDTMVAALKGKGFRALPKGKPKGSKGAAEHPVAGKARALWISLWQLGVVHNPAEEALEAFAKRQLGCERMAWMRQSEGYRLVEALKAMGRKAGWTMHDRTTGKPLGPAMLRASLCEAILIRLKEAGLAPADWWLRDAAWKLLGIEIGKDGAWTAEDYIRLADGLGRVLREQAPQAVRP